MPQHRFQHATGAAVVQQAGVAVDVMDQADAPQRRGFPLAAIGQSVGAAIGQPCAHVVQQEVAVGRDALAVEGLAAELRVGARRGDIAGPVAGVALRLGEQLLAVPHLRVIGRAAGRRRQGGLVEHHVAEGLVVDFRRLALGALATTWSGQAILLRGGTALVREHAGGDADVAVESAGGLVGDSCDVGLPAETAQHRLAGGGIPDAVGDALDGAVEGGLFTGVIQDFRFRDGFQQAHADDLRRDARADQHLPDHRAVAEIAEAVVRLLQHVGGAVGKAAAQFGIRDIDLAFRLHVLHGKVVELVAVGRFRHGFGNIAAAGYGQA